VEKTILIVENHDKFQTMIRKQLKMMFPQHNIVVADSAEEAFSVIDAYPPQVILMAIKLPKMNGIEATRQIKKTKPDTQVVMVTHYEEAILQKIAADAGASAYVVKSALNKELIPVLASLL
jgi:DNA-binding NarL/FixJ family response regulator